MANLIITIDGPAASGKSTVARLLAERLGASFLDTGAMYRAVTLAAIQAGVDMSNEEKLLDVLNNREFQFAVKKNKMVVCIDGVNVTEQIRQPDVTANAKHIASAVKLRKKLVEMQRQFAAGEEKIVTEGRDQGTVAFPNADIKFFLTAQTFERARRRQAELRAKGCSESLEKILRAIEERDKSDTSRAAGPLRPADDAIVIDTTDLSIEKVVTCLVSRVSCLVSGERRVTGHEKMRWFRFARWCCKVFCNLFFHLCVYGKENVPKQGAFVLVGNHQSFLDPVFCGIPLKRPLFFLARDSLFKNRFFGWLISSVNTIPVKRSTADLPAMKKVIGKLKEGNGVCLFPEATRTRNGKITPFKPGFGLLCRRGKAAVVPVVIDGAFECWPRHKKIFSPGAHIIICYGKCIPANQVKNMSDRKLAEVLTDTLRQMQNDYRVKQGKEPYNY
jgi:cytidylate kinase